MDYQQKAAALEALGNISIRFRSPGDWYVQQHVEIKDGSVLVGAYGNGETPIAAIEDHWNELTDLKNGQYLVVDALRKRRAVRWNGFMWADVTEPLVEPKLPAPTDNDNTRGGR